MRLRCILGVLLLVILVAATVEVKKKQKKRKGCELNKKVYKPGKTAYKDRAHCLKLKCVREKKTKGKKTRYLLKAMKYRNCQCFPILCRGPRCTPPIICPMCTEIWEPVCGTNNVTYPNECQFFGSTQPCGSDDASILSYGECGQCPVGCPKNIDLVCGSNGQTYNNECLMITEACETNANITKANDGKCNLTLPSSGTGEKCGKCDKRKKPVCGSNGVTYSNQCLLEAAVCEGENVTLAYEGDCVSEAVPPSQRLRKQCKYNGKKYNAGDIIEDMIDFCLTAICQPSRKPGQSKVEFLDFQGANACECSSDRLRRQILRISRE